MFIRLYFLLPDELLTKRVVDELTGTGIKHQQIHALKRNRNEQKHPSKNPQWQRLDMAQRIEKLAWNSNLVVFFIALLMLIFSLMTSLTGLAIAAVVVMLATFLLGDIFASRIPKVHLQEFEDALSHGEVLLMVDVPEKRVVETEDRVLSHHPAAIAGGSSWTIHSLGI